MCLNENVICLKQPFFYCYIQAEVDYLGEVYHQHLVKLVGYCIEGEQRLLVYEFMQKGSLENHLFRSKLFIICINFSFCQLKSVLSY